VEKGLRWDSDVGYYFVVDTYFLDHFLDHKAIRHNGIKELGMTKTVAEGFAKPSCRSTQRNQSLQAR
jgi:hypothetical protein